MAIKADFQRVEVLWLDSAATQGWHDMDELPTHAGVINLVSVGYLAVFSKDYLVIVQTHHQKDNTVDRWAEALSIPRQCVQKIKVLR